MTTRARANRDESWILFLSHRSGNNLLYRMRPDGSELTPIFGGELKDVPGMEAGRTLYRQPHWSRQSPDRAYFLSWATDTNVESGQMSGPIGYVIHLGRTDGGATRIMTNRAGEVFTWARSSEAFAYSRFAGRNPRRDGGQEPALPSTQIVIAQIDGSGEATVLEKPGYWTACDWSPDGNKLLLLYWGMQSMRYGRTDLIELDLARAEQARIKTMELRPGMDFPSSSDVEYCLNSLTDGLPIAWFADGRYSPDGTRIATTVRRRARLDDPGFHELALFDLASETLSVIADYPHPSRIHGPLSWSPDGEEILFSRPLEPDDRRENLPADVTGLGIWAIKSDGSSARFLTTGWAPDWQ
ncbi:TolB-like translocation protein [Aquisphaera giovannonii]|nr:hypothetical protein [Aquisphaera giovannonii]